MLGRQLFRPSVYQVDLKNQQAISQTQLLPWMTIRTHTHTQNGINNDGQKEQTQIRINHQATVTSTTPHRKTNCTVHHVATCSSLSCFDVFNILQHAIEIQNIPKPLEHRQSLRVRARAMLRRCTKPTRRVKMAPGGPANPAAQRKERPWWRDIFNLERIEYQTVPVTHPGHHVDS